MLDLCCCDFFYFEGVVQKGCGREVCLYVVFYNKNPHVRVVDLIPVVTVHA